MLLEQLLQFRPSDSVARVVAELSQPPGSFDAAPAIAVKGGAGTQGMLALAARTQWPPAAGGAADVITIDACKCASVH